MRTVPEATSISPSHNNAALEHRTYQFCQLVYAEKHL